MKNNNKGLTLVELIVVMAIIVIIIAIVGLSISATNSARTERLAVSVNSLLSKCRTDSLGRSGSVYLTISIDSSGNIICEHSDGAVVSTDTFSANGIEVFYTTEIKASSPVTLALSGHPLTLSFDRATGGQEAQPNGSFCKSIIFAGSRTYTIELTPSTGFHRVL